MGARRALSVTIDGPAGSGKSVTARRAAEELGFRYVDSGALYRTVAWKALKRGDDLGDPEALADLVRRTDLRFELREGILQVWADGLDVSNDIRRPDVTQVASRIARLPEVREALTLIQRRMAAEGDVVLEGRDSGTVVLPGAEVKIFLTASLAARAERRHRELARAGVDVLLEEVERDLAARDNQDSTRVHSPLRKPEGALEIDTSGLTIDEQVAAVVDAVRRVAEGGGTSDIDLRTADRGAGMGGHYGFFWRLLNVLGVVFAGFRVVGRSHVPVRGGCIVACNHVSFWDPPIVGMAIPREVHFLAKRQLFRNRVFGWLISTFNAMPIERDRIDRQGLRSAQNLLRSGGALLVFPEGTRQKSGRLGKALPGAGALSIATGVPVVPAYVSGTRAFWRNVYRRGRLCVRFGDPLAPEEGAAARRSEAARELTNRVMERIAGLARESRGTHEH